MVGGMKSFVNVKNKYFWNADRTIFNNFQTKRFLPVMDGRLRFPQVSTHSPLFYENPGHYGRGSRYMFKTIEV